MRGEVANPKLATLEAIERVHGVAVDATRRSVDESELDGISSTRGSRTYNSTAKIC